MFKNLYTYITDSISNNSSTDELSSSDSEVGSNEAKNDLQCRNCQKPKKQFVCANCINRENCSNKTTLKNLKKELKECSDTYDQRRQDDIVYENLKYAVNEKERQLKVLEKLIEEKRAKIQELNEQKNKLQLQNIEKSKKITEMNIQSCNFEKQLISRQQEQKKLLEKNKKITKLVENTSRSKIEQLIKYIFPISSERTQLKQSVARSSAQDDDWVFYVINEVQYRIVGPTLPANGNYEPYMELIEERQFNETDVEPSRNSKHCVLAAFTYTTQLVQLMYYCLGVRMPQKLVYSAFCKELSKDHILKKIRKLNLSIMHLAYTQNVKMHTMNENHTLENILIILDTKRSDLGHFGFQAVGNAPLVKSVDSLLVNIDDISQPITDSDSEEDCESDISFLDMDELSNVEEINETKESNLSQSFISAASSQITSIFNWTL